MQRCCRRRWLFFLCLLCGGVQSNLMGEKRRGANSLELPEPSPGESGALVRLYLCRHGQTDYNAEGKIQGSGVDRSLSEVGLAQAESIGEALRDIPLDMIGSSTLTRAIQTAEAISKRHPGANRVEHEGLREMNFGDMEGKVLEDFRHNYQILIEAWAVGDVRRRWPGGGESPFDVESRARAALRDLGIIGVNCERGVRHVALVTHGRFNKILLASLLGEGLNRAGLIKQENCCINVIDIDPCAPFDSTTACTKIVINFFDHLK
ncbi:hypothetical protein CTAYLR_002764 [Chrysophaeum taylorii]|uniref:Phosphoglycerate mutase n=1 Tax=Chrysophaeum taylorii TaxID=2483200 RepID=A0AAD7UCQ9_9STRA|nr:hypothetical protein CTAYLR_002764 [Chrysophaeum taylorii]